MKSKVKKHLERVLSHLYINPLERCNLRCKICYTRKTAPILSEKEILEFTDRYQKAHKLETVTFCGGEVFTLPYFPGLVNKLVRSVHFSDSAARARRHPLLSVHTPPYSRAQMQRSSKRTSSSLFDGGIFVQIITNGTIDSLDEFANPNMVNLIVSLDGLRPYHDKNRGEGNFERSIKFLQKAQKLGFHTEIFSIVTKQNLPEIDRFENYLKENLGKNISVTYHPRKPPAYLLHHPISNIFGETDGFDFLSDSEMVKIIKERKTFPPKELGCYQIALVSDSKVYGCCEGTVPIGKMDDDINLLFGKLKERIEIWEKTNALKNCLGCSQSDFMCGIKKYLTQL